MTRHRLGLVGITLVACLIAAPASALAGTGPAGTVSVGPGSTESASGDPGSTSADPGSTRTLAGGPVAGGTSTEDLNPVESQASTPDPVTGIRRLTESEQVRLAAEQGANGAAMGGADTLVEDGTTQGLRTQELTTAQAWSPGGVQGVDVSRWQGTVDWPRVKALGGSFAFVKATEGTTYRSPTWSAQYNGAAGVGLLRGSYHFALPPTSSGAEQARFLVANGGAWRADGMTLPPVLDIEFNKYSTLGNTCYNMTPAQLQAWILDFVRTTDSLIGRHPIIYTNKYWWDTCVQGTGFGSYPLWIARYTQTPPPDVPAGWSSHHFWQYSDAGPFGFDSNQWHAGYAELVEFARLESSIGPNGPASTPVPAVLDPGDSITSPNGLFRLVMQSDGNLVTYDDRNRPVWASTTYLPGRSLTHQRDGNLVIYVRGQARWHTGTTPGSNHLVSLQDDGNLVVRDASGNGQWDAFGFSGRPTYRVQTSVGHLGWGDTIRSLNGAYQLHLQRDGNLVLYRHGVPTWSAPGTLQRGANLYMQADGNAVVYGHSGEPVWASRTSGGGSVMVIQDDGNLVIYTPKGVWHTGTG